MTWLLRQLRKDLWSPEVAGVGLGLVYVLALWLSHRAPGASGTFFNAAAILGKPLTVGDPANQFFVTTFPPLTEGLGWQFYMVVGIFFGALASVLIAGKFRWTWIPIEQWKDVFGNAIWKRWVIAFVGGDHSPDRAGIAGGVHQRLLWQAACSSARQRSCSSPASSSPARLCNCWSTGTNTRREGLTMPVSIPDILVALALGFLFGWVLDKGGLNRYYKIANVFRFTDLTVLRFMMTGMLVGMIGIYGLKALGLVDLTAVSATVLAGNLIGGAVFGVGMSLSGF